MSQQVKKIVGAPHLTVYQGDRTTAESVNGKNLFQKAE